LHSISSSRRCSRKFPGGFLRPCGGDDGGDGGDGGDVAMAATAATAKPSTIHRLHRHHRDFIDIMPKRLLWSVASTKKTQEGKAGKVIKLEVFMVDFCFAEVSET
jgi:hypothetical protein